jgi:CubicO group peptidase (beta-lactamase class C family)
LGAFSRPFRRVLLTFGLGVLLLATRAPLQADDLVYGRFGDYLESLRLQTGIPGLAAVIVGRSDIQWERAFGYQDVERSIVTRTDTPMHVDGLTEAFTATLILQCVEQGRLSFDDRVGQFKASSPDANLTLRQLLTHTTESSAFSYRPDHLDVLSPIIRACTSDSFRETLANELDRLGMADSVPGPDVVNIVPPAEGVLTSEFNRYSRILGRLAVPYAVDAQKKASISQYSATTLTPTSGLVTTARDLAKFDLGLRTGVIVRIDTLAAAWRAAAGAPHGMGWFVQGYNGENIVWQFGSGGNGSSSMMITVPGRSLTVILTANSNGLAKGFSLGSGDILASPFARAFLGLFVI